jgi:hypothetical protein
MKTAKENELEEMKRGLEAAESLDSLIDRLVTQKTATHLHEIGVAYARQSGHMLAVAGVYFLAEKEKRHREGHRDFKDSFKGKSITYMHAWQCMKAAMVVSKHSIFGDLRSSRAFRSLLLLPEPDRAAIAEEIKGVPEEHIAELLPNKIQKRYDELKRQKAKTRVKTASGEAQDEDLATEIEEREWRTWLSDYNDAFAQLGKLYDGIKPEWHERIIEQGLMAKLGARYDALIQRTHPVEEIRKQAIVRHTPGYRRRPKI